MRKEGKYGKKEEIQEGEPRERRFRVGWYENMMEEVRGMVGGRKNE